VTLGKNQKLLLGYIRYWPKETILDIEELCIKIPIIIYDDEKLKNFHVQ
jgi:hypothetical protein